jgi:hypothetical protein
MFFQCSYHKLFIPILSNVSIILSIPCTSAPHQLTLVISSIALAFLKILYEICLHITHVVYTFGGLKFYTTILTSNYYTSKSFKKKCQGI